MRNVLRHKHEVFHFWANQVQSQGKAGNVFFRDSMIFSYGTHFCIARLAPGNRVAFTNRQYSVTTSTHVGAAMGATSNRTLYFVDDPSASAGHNIVAATNKIAELLHRAKKPRIRKSTIAGLYAEAKTVAEGANQFQRDFPDRDTTWDEIPTDELDLFVAAHVRELQDREAMAEEARKRRAEAGREDLEKWKRGEKDTYPHYFNDLPVALRRVFIKERDANQDVIETSRGAEIPVADAKRLWPVIQRCKDKREVYSAGLHAVKVGVYTLNMIRADGSIVVGCHDIPYSEIERMAVELGLLQGEPA